MNLETVKTLAEDAKDLRAQYLGKVNQLRKAVREADNARDGKGRNELARAASAGLSRRLVYEVLGAEDLLAKAKEIAEGADQRFEVFEKGVGSVCLSTRNYPDTDRYTFSSEDFGDGTVEAAARRVLGRLRDAGIKVPPYSAEELADYGKVHLS